MEHFKRLYAKASTISIHYLHKSKGGGEETLVFGFSEPVATCQVSFIPQLADNLCLWRAKSRQLVASPVLVSFFLAPGISSGDGGAGRIAIK